MITIKTPDDIKKMKEGGIILADITSSLIEKIKPGITGLEIDKLAESLIKKAGGFPSFKMVKGYSHATCICVNDIVVHGLPKNTPLNNKDIVGIDIGIFYQGFHNDMSWTTAVGGVEPEIEKFLNTGKKALINSIKKAIPGNYIGHLSKAIQETVEKEGYSPVRILVGHGIGKNLHEDPPIPGFLKGEVKNTPLIKEGMVLAVEVIYNKGTHKVMYGNEDGWTILTQDKEISGLFELTIAIVGSKPIILTNSAKFAKIGDLAL